MCKSRRANSVDEKTRVSFIICVVVGTEKKSFVVKKRGKRKSKRKIKEKKMSEASVATSQMALPSTSSYSNLITAEIRVENLSTSNAAEQSATATISVPTTSQATSNDVAVGDSSSSSNCTEEPEKKRQKIDAMNPLKSKKMEKLESRLGGILCCAVCLDLPKSAMYQVSSNNLPVLLFCSSFYFATRQQNFDFSI